MKKMKQFIKALRDRASAKRRAERNIQYYDNYTLLGSILGGYCGMLRFDDRQR